MKDTIQTLCTALDLLQLAEINTPGDTVETLLRRSAVVRAAKAARPALECLKAGVQPKRLTVQAEAFGWATGAADRARMEVVA